MKTAIKSVIFDIGNVLVTFDHRKMCHQIAALCDLETNQISEEIFRNNLGARYERGELTTSQIVEHLEKLSGKKLNSEEILRAMSDIFEPNTAIFSFVHELKSKGFSLGLLSNTSEAHFNFLTNKFEIFSLFDFEILSFRVKALKPEPAIYKAAIQAANHRAEECLLIDDLEANVAGALNIGLKTIHFLSNDQFANDLNRHLGSELLSQTYC